MRGKNERRPRPVVVANCIAAMINAVLVAGVEFGLVGWSSAQQAAAMMVVGAALNLGAALYGQRQVTPLKWPQDDTGIDMVRKDGHPAVRR